MKIKLKYPVVLCLIALFTLSSCSSGEGNLNQSSNLATSSDTMEVVATTTMLHDLCTIVGGEKVITVGLFPVGVDPHLHEPSARDTTTLENADVIVYNGLHLEGKMTDVFARMESQNKCIISVEDAMDPTFLLVDEEDADSSDPHIWFDPTLWMVATSYIAEELGKNDPDNAEYYQENAENYVKELEELDEYIQSRIEEVPENARVLVTAHDAFQYFGNRYDFEVMGMQGVATNSEATTADISDLADVIVERELKAVFVETSVSSKNMEALQEAVAAQGFHVELGGELYSDSLGEGEHGTYLTTYRSNIDTIVDALVE